MHARAKQWTKDHPDRRAEITHREYVKHRQRKSIYGKQWRHQNRGKVLLYKRLSEAKRRKRHYSAAAADEHVTRQQLEAQYKRQQGKCHYCGKNLNGAFQIDHVVPLSKGGAHIIDNIVVTCRDCNQSKKDKFPHEWKKGGRLL